MESRFVLKKGLWVVSFGGNELFCDSLVKRQGLQSFPRKCGVLRFCGAWRRC